MTQRANAAERIRVSGFTMVRNATRLDYPFEESIRSLLPLCDEVIINVGDSSDDTWKICETLRDESAGKIRLLQSVWTKEAQSGGYQLKLQTDIALAECRGEWCFYLQADEVLHEADYDKVRGAMNTADKLPEVDGILFDYVHFYGGFNYAITGRNWYRREVRAFKNGRGLAAYRDAQGFRKGTDETRPLVIRSGARIFHYGYVRTPASLRQKSHEMALWWGESPASESDDLKLHNHVGLRKFPTGHPAVMKTRVARSPEFDPKAWPRKWDGNELKNAITLVWESVVPYRIGEFRNYEITNER